MTLLILSFLSGVLTIAAPCILPLLPVIVGGTLAKTDLKQPERNWRQPLYIALGLTGSIILFTLLLKATTAFLGVPQAVWKGLSGGILILLGISFLAPSVWEKIALRSGLYGASNKLLGKSFKKNGWLGSVMIGAALGPVFGSCSPTYVFVVAAILPASWFLGISYLLAYAIGLSVTLIAIALLGQSFAAKLGWLSNPHGALKKTIGIIFLVIGMAVLFGIDKRIETFILDKGFYDPILNLEQSIRR